MKIFKNSQKMNTKKYRKRAPKLTQKADRGSQNRRAAEGNKSNNIAAKRVTVKFRVLKKKQKLLPGFLVNGFTSSTVQKVKEDSKRRKNHIIADDLQTFLEQKGMHPRRSQRILKKNFGQQSIAAGSKTSTGTHCDILGSTPQGIHNPNSISFKSILKNNSKSLFKDISDRFSKVNIHNTEAVGQIKSVPNEEIRNGDQNFDYSEEISNHLDQTPYPYFSENRLDGSGSREPLDFLRIDLNRSFCRNLEKQINVTFRRNAVDECREKVRKEIELVKIALEGKANVDKEFVHGSIDNRSEVDSREGGPPTKFYPVPAQNWVYSTPPSQKIGAPQIEECQLHAGVLYHNKNQQNLYEVQPSSHVDFSKLRNTERVPIDDRFMKKVAQVKKTPAPVNFQFGNCRGGNAVPQNLFQQSWRDSAKCGGGSGGVQLCGQQETFVNPNFVNIITRPTKLTREPIFINYLENRVPTPQVRVIAKQNNTELRDCSVSTALDFTFVEEGSDFKMRQSQPTSEQRNKRRLSAEELVIKRRNVFITEPTVICDNDKMFEFSSQQERDNDKMFDFGSQKRENDKMFNFGSQQRNMFDFGKV